MHIVLIAIIICVLIVVFFDFSSKCEYFDSRENSNFNDLTDLIYLCYASYYINDQIELEKYLKLSKFELSNVSSAFDENSQSSCLMGYDHQKATTYIAFTGTNITNYVTILDDLDAFLVTYPYGDGNVSDGFLSAFDGLKDEIISYIVNNPSVEIVLTGHSLGGALAVLCGSYLHFSGINSRIVTFGAPKVGDQTFSNAFNGLGLNCLQVANIGDVVPHLPFESLGFTHIKTSLILSCDGLCKCELNGQYVFPYNAFDWLNAHSLDTYVNLVSFCDL